MVHALAARHDVAVQRTAGGGGPSRGNALDDLAMLAGRNREHAALGERCMPEKMQLVTRRR